MSRVTHVQPFDDKERIAQLMRLVGLATGALEIICIGPNEFSAEGVKGILKELKSITEPMVCLELPEKNNYQPL